MLKLAFCLMAACTVATFSCSAADLDSVDYYSLAPVQSLSPTVNSALDYTVQPLDLSSDESNWLKGIWQGITQTSSLNPNGGSLLYNIQQLRTSFSSFAGMNFWDYVMDDIEDIRVELSEDYSYTLRSLISDIRDAFYTAPSVSPGSLIGMIREMNVALGLIEVDSDTTANSVEGIWGDTEDILTGLNLIVPDVDSLNTNFSSLYAFLTRDFRFVISGYDSTGSPTSSTESNLKLNWTLMNALVSLSTDGVDDGKYTLYSLIKRLADVNASFDDVALVESQKANREEIEDSFLSGSSGSTSLGVSDFGDLADVGGTIKDSLSLDGNATIGSFTSGLAAADSAGQGWFSEETRSQLDAVSSTVTYSLRDSDPYNMVGWEDRYYWLLGDDK